MMTRHEIREEAFLLLFQMSVGKFEIGEIIEADVESFELEVNQTAVKLAENVYTKENELNTIIGYYSKTRAVSRIAAINLIIMRIALYEMIYDKDNVPPKAAINEAVELSKKYSDPSGTKFINGILDAYFNDKDKNKIFSDVKNEGETKV